MGFRSGEEAPGVAGPPSPISGSGPDEGNRMRRTIAVMLGIGALVACLAAANLARDPGSFEIDWRIVKLPPKEVVVEPPTRGEIVQTITAPGLVEPVDEAEIASQIVGRVIEVRVEEGDAVKKGDLLVKLDETEARARL